MLGGHKKKNPTPPDNSDDKQQLMIPREMPPLRMFVIRHGEPAWNEKTLCWERPVLRTVEAHGLGIDEERMISFVVFFFLDGEARQQPAQANKLVLNADAWDEVEEINALFPETRKH